MKAGLGFSIVIGLVIFAWATWGRAAESGAAIGVFFVLLGLIGFVNLRIARLEAGIKQSRKDGDE